MKHEGESEEDGLEESDESDGEESSKKRKTSDSDIMTATSKSPHRPEQPITTAAPDLSLANRSKSPTPNSYHSEYPTVTAAPDLSLANRLKSPTPHRFHSEHPTTTAASDLSVANRPKDEKEGERTRLKAQRFPRWRCFDPVRTLGDETLASDDGSCKRIA